MFLTRVYSALTWGTVVQIWVSVHALHIRQFIIQKRANRKLLINFHFVFKFEQIIKNESKCKLANQKSLYNFKNVRCDSQMHSVKPNNPDVDAHKCMAFVYCPPTLLLLLSRLLVIFDASSNTNEKKPLREQIKFAQKKCVHCANTQQ